ncbi:MAG: hypothetical protein PHC39_04595 [Proteiniphilum sp.]|nr:hypothetical protein [Proteiniphilum sp.]
MSYPVPLSFKDREFDIINKAADGSDIREFIKLAAVEKAERIVKEREP